MQGRTCVKNQYLIPVFALCNVPEQDIILPDTACFKEEMRQYEITKMQDIDVNSYLISIQRDTSYIAKHIVLHCKTYCFTR